MGDNAQCIYCPNETNLTIKDAMKMSMTSKYWRAMETNGTNPLPANLDWSTVSPKGEVAVRRCNELKILFGAGGQMRPMVLPRTEADYYYLQPCDTGDDAQNRLILQACVEFIKANPKWRLSLQTHKLAGFK